MAASTAAILALAASRQSWSEAPAQAYDFWTKEKSPISNQPFRNRLYDKLIDKKAIRSVFEIGAGLGEFARYCHDNLIGYCGLEPNEKMLGALQNDFHVLYGKAPESLMSFYCKVDCVFAAHLIEHLKGHEEILQTIRLAKNFLNPGGKLILLYPDIEKSGALFYRDYTHTYPTTKKRVEDMLTDCGMKIERSGYYSGPFTNPLAVGLIHQIFKFVPMPETWRSRIQVCGYTIAI